MGKPCAAFDIECAEEAWEHLRKNRQRIVNYGSDFEGQSLHTWDDGERFLCRCRCCGGYSLWQDSEFHSAMDCDSYYTDVFPVSGQEEAEKLNRRWDGWEIEDHFPGRYMAQDDYKPPHWTYGKAEADHGQE